MSNSANVTGIAVHEEGRITIKRQRAADLFTKEQSTIFGNLPSEMLVRALQVR
jgi:hypothetical protein